MLVSGDGITGTRATLRGKAIINPGRKDWVTFPAIVCPASHSSLTPDKLIVYKKDLSCSK
jgi:hypothetical protein